VKPQFIEVGGIVFPVDRIVVDFREAGKATVIAGRNSYSFEGEDAAGLRRFFVPEKPNGGGDAQS